MERRITQPLTIKNCTFKNRLVMPPLATSKALEDGSISEDILAYYDEKAKDGSLGLIITEHSFIHEEGKASLNQMSISRDEDIEGLKKLTDTIHQYGTKVIAQINHSGSGHRLEDQTNVGKAPSAVEHPVTKNMGKEMTIEDIKAIVTYFKAAALRAKKAGYDGVEIHSAHSYLLNQFYSPLTNQRQDVYGGSLDNRIRIHLEVIQAVKEAVGDNFIIALRLGASDYTEGGTTLEDSLYAVKKFEEAGIDLLDISGGFCRYMNPYNKNQGYFAELTRAIKEVVSIPVILTGGIIDGTEVENLLEKDADLLGVGRAIFKNSHWAKENLNI